MKSIYQSSEWKEIKEALKEKTVKTEFLSFEVDKKLPALGTKKILFSEGTPEANNPQLKEQLAEFKEEAKKYFYGIIRPTVLDERKEVFEEAGFRRIANHTILIGLEKEEKELWSGMEKKSARWGVKTAEKNKLACVKAQKKDLDDFYEIYKETAEKGGFSPEPKKFLELAQEKSIATLYVIKSGKKTVAGGLLIHDKSYNYSIVDLTGSTEDGTKLQAMPFLYWNFIKLAKTLGNDFIDLGGYDAESKKGDKTYNINKFKERFGGKIVEQPVYATNWKYPFLRRVFRCLKKIR